MVVVVGVVVVVVFVVVIYIDLVLGWLVWCIMRLVAVVLVMVHACRWLSGVIRPSW